MGKGLFGFLLGGNSTRQSTSKQALEPPVNHRPGHHAPKRKGHQNSRSHASDHPAQSYEHNEDHSTIVHKDEKGKSVHGDPESSLTSATSHPAEKESESARGILSRKLKDCYDDMLSKDESDCKLEDKNENQCPVPLLPPPPPPPLPSTLPLDESPRNYGKSQRGMRGKSYDEDDVLHDFFTATEIKARKAKAPVPGHTLPNQSPSQLPSKPDPMKDDHQHGEIESNTRDELSNDTEKGMLNSDSGYSEATSREDGGAGAGAGAGDKVKQEEVRMKEFSYEDALNCFESKFPSITKVHSVESEDISESDDDDDQSGSEDEGELDCRSSVDSLDDPEVMKLKAAIHEVKEKFRQAMEANAGLENERNALQSRVESIKEKIDDEDEHCALKAKELKDKSAELSSIEQSHSETVKSVQSLKARMERQTRFLVDRGLVIIDLKDIIGSFVSNDRSSHMIVSFETAKFLRSIASDRVDVKLKKLKDNHEALKAELDELRATKKAINGLGGEDLIGILTSRLQNAKKNLEDLSSIVDSLCIE